MNDGGPSEQAKLREYYAGQIVAGMYADPDTEPWPADDILDKADVYAIEAMVRRKRDEEAEFHAKTAYAAEARAEATNEV